MSSGRSLSSLDSDPIVQETVRGLEKLAETRLSVVAHALTGVLDGLAKVGGWDLWSRKAGLGLTSRPDGDAI